MLTSVPYPSLGPAGPTGRATDRVERTRTPSRIDGIELRLRRLADSSEPAVVFTSLVRLCVPWYCDVCTVDIVEGGRVRYSVSYPKSSVGSPATVPNAEQSILTAFESDLPGWASYSGVMTSRWLTRRSTAEDEDRAASIVEHAVRMVRSERLADPVRSRLARSAATSARWTQQR